MKYKRKRNRLQRFLLRLQIAIRVAFYEKHVLVIYLKRQDIIDLIVEDKIKQSVSFSYAGMLEHQAARVLKTTGEWMNDVEIICSKAEFDVNAEEIINH